MRDRTSPLPISTAGTVPVASGPSAIITSSASTAPSNRDETSPSTGRIVWAIAFEWVKAHCTELGIDPEKFEKYDLNIHVPEGAIPKDGPSAGITMVTSIVSTYTGRKVRDRIAMTGETTLRGRVTPVGGIKEKILAAKRAGITTLLLPEENRKDIEEIKPDYIRGLTFHYVRTNDDVLQLALEPQAQQ